MDKKRRTVLSQKEIGILVDIWRSHLNKLRSCRRNSHILAEIANELKQYGIILSVQEVRTRIQNLTKKYREEKKKSAQAGGAPSDWELYDDIHNMFAGLNELDELIEDVKNYCTSPSVSSSGHLSPEPRLLTPMEGPSFSTVASPINSLRRGHIKRKRKKYGVIKLLSLVERQTVAFENYCKQTKESSDRQIAILERIANYQQQVTQLLPK